MKKNFISICICILIMLIIIIGFYQYESYKLSKKNSNIDTYIDKYNRLSNEIIQYKVLLNNISLLNTDSDDLNLKLNDLKEEIDILEEKINTINDKISQIS